MLESPTANNQRLIRLSSGNAGKYDNKLPDQSNLANCLTIKIFLKINEDEDFEIFNKLFKSQMDENEDSQSQHPIKFVGKATCIDIEIPKYLNVADSIRRTIDWFNENFEEKNVLLC